MSFSKATDRRVTRHNTNAGPRQSYQRCASTSARGRMCGVRTRMSATYNQNIEITMFHVKQSLLAEAEAGKDIIQHIFYIHPSYQRIERSNSASQLLCRQIGGIFTIAQEV